MSSFSERPTVEVDDQQSKPNYHVITQINDIMPVNKFQYQYQHHQYQYQYQHHQYQEEEEEEEEQCFPPGYRFCPTDSELIVYYLQKKVLNMPLPHDKIKDVNLYSYNPQHLTASYPVLGDNDWYFFSPRDRKYPKGKRPNRAAGDGYWKATGIDKPIKHKNEVVGYKKSLVFYLGKAPRGDKTNWIMKEYTLVDAPPVTKKSENDMRLDNWVLCRVYQKNKSKKKEQDDENHDSGRHSPNLFNVPQNVPQALENNVTQMNLDNNGIGNSNTNGFFANNFNNFGAHQHHHQQPTSVNYWAQQFGFGHHLGHSNQNISSQSICPSMVWARRQETSKEDCLNIPNGDKFDSSLNTFPLESFSSGDGFDNNFSSFYGAYPPPN
ncbi:NAC domain-containing protein 1-like [Actinidia eriantha]|uniref:NAC domain-containing protein 1-like n=1 Tax=Actinidia eriantha TaxID=165200 RepID=UPI002586BAD9|nr:NAC domain-containing protein 1-like [Actinidia eriantha]